MFHTYSEAFGSNLYTLDSWLIFLQCDLSAEVLRLAKSQSITAAMIIWSRHKVTVQREWYGFALSIFISIPAFSPSVLQRQTVMQIGLSNFVDSNYVRTWHLIMLDI